MFGVLPKKLDGSAGGKKLKVFPSELCGGDGVFCVGPLAGTGLWAWLIGAAVVLFCCCCGFSNGRCVGCCVLGSLSVKDGGDLLRALEPPGGILFPCAFWWKSLEEKVSSGRENGLAFMLSPICRSCWCGPCLNNWDCGNGLACVKVCCVCWLLCC